MCSLVKIAVQPVGYLETGILYCGDNLERLTQLPTGSIDLVYLDPPFFSNRNYEVIWGDEAEMRSFEDRWEGGISHYINWMKERVYELHRVLKPTGSLFFHCDWHAGHYLKVMLDEIFGSENFVNEIVWSYRKWSTGKYAFQRNHDTIFFYSRSGSKDRTFNQLYMERAASTLKRFGNAKITSGHDEDGRRVPSEIGAEESEGVRMNDVWEISRVAPVNQLFPTQKPRPLLERIIEAATNKGDIVLDPFCGCGTAMVAAEMLRRQWIGIDISPTAVSVMKRRLLKETGAQDIELVGMPVNEDELRELKPFEFQNWVMQRLNGTHSARKSGDMGIDGFSFMNHDPIQVKQSDHIGRNVVDNCETALERAGKATGYIIGFSFTKGAIEEVARAKAKGKADIHLVKVASLVGPEDQPDVRSRDLMSLFPSKPKNFLDLPLYDGRDKKARPSPEELLESAAATRS